MTKKLEEKKQDEEKPKLYLRPKTTSSLNAVNMQREKSNSKNKS